MSDALMPSTVKIVSEWLKGESAVTDIFDTRISYRLTGTYPAIRLTDLGPITRGPAEQLRRVQVECWAVDYDTAERGAATVESVITNSRATYAGIGYCAGGAVESGPFANPDPASGKFRHQLDVALWLYPIALAGLNGLFPLDGTNDPWQWAPGEPWWVGPAYEVTWSTGDEVPVPDLPVGGESVTLFVVDAATYLAARAAPAGGNQVNDTNPSPLVKFSGGSGIAFLGQYQPGYSAVMNAPPNPELDVTTMLRGVPGLRPFDGTNDPWRWDPTNFVWVGPAVEVTWSAGDEVPAFALPAGAFEVDLYVADAATYPDARAFADANGTKAISDNPTPMMMAADGSGIAFLAQYQSPYSEVMDEPFNPELDIATMLGDVTVGAPYVFPDSGATLVTAIPDPWQWSDAWGGWVGPAYELTWLTGDTITPADIDLNYRIIVIEDPAPVAPDDSTYLTGWTTTSGLAPIVATADGSGVGYVIQHEAGFSHTEVPTPALDPATMFGDFTVGAPYVFFPPAPVLYPWPE